MYYTSKWDPVSTLGLENEQKYNSITCTGYARTRGRRCQRTVAASKVGIYVGILNRLAAEKGPLKSATSAELRKAATISLCWQHDGDLDDVTREWGNKLIQLALKMERADGCRKAARGTSAKPEKTTRWHPRIKLEDLKYYASAYGSESSDAPECDSDDSDENWDASSVEDADQDEKDAEEELRRQEEELRRQEEERRRKERERRSEEERAARERRRREAERKMREEEARREAREREDRIKERARKRAEDEVRKTKDMWSSAWDTYTKGWTRVMNQKPGQVRVEMIPWPVKSGRWEDVTGASVNEFFSKALPVLRMSEAVDTRYSLISAETKRWHTDKIKNRFGPDVCCGQYGEALKIIEKEVVRLFKLSQAERQKWRSQHT